MYLELGGLSLKVEIDDDRYRHDGQVDGES